jgi:hypothetical protein
LNGDHANRIFPLGANTYLELNGIVNAESVVTPKNRPWWYEKVQTVGECFTGLGFRVDTLEELQAIAQKKRYTFAQMPIARIRPNGYVLRAFSAPSAQTTWPRGLPNGTGSRISPMHPSGQPPVSWPNITRPDGIAWIEVATEKEMATGWMCPSARFHSSSTASCPAFTPSA